MAGRNRLETLPATGQNGRRSRIATPMGAMERLLTFLESQPTDLRSRVRWLLLGRRLAEALYSDFVQEPTFEELLEMSRWIRQGEPDLLGMYMQLARNSSYWETLLTEVQLDTLVEQAPASWNHPVQLLARPRSPYGVLLESCQRRLKEADESVRWRLESVAEKLQNVIELEERARQRRMQCQRP